MCGSERNSSPRSARSAISGPSASLKNAPPISGSPSAKRPSARTGFTTGIVLARMTSRSSAPKAGARCTRPVPSAVVTKVPLTTRCESGISIRVNGRWYSAPSKSAPPTVASTCHPSPSTRRQSASATTTLSPVPDRLAITYSTSGWTATAVLDTSVHGVVVQTSRSAPARCGFAPVGTRAIGNRTMTEGSTTSR